MIPDEAIEAAARVFANEADPYGGWDSQVDKWNEPARESARQILEAAAPYLIAEYDLMLWKLNSLAGWANAMVQESNSPQYGRDVKSILGVASMDEARQMDAL